MARFRSLRTSRYSGGSSAPRKSTKAAIVVPPVVVDPPVELAPVFSVDPVITGMPTEGQTLSATTGTASGSPTYARQWKRNGAPINGATSATYVLVNADVGAVITVTSTATNSAGSVSSTSAGTATIAAIVVTPPGDTTAPTITSASSLSVAENAAFSHTLTANESVTWSKVGGADAALFTLAGNTLAMSAKDFEAPADADANNSYVVQVRATDTAGNFANQTITIAVTNVAEAAIPGAITAPTIAQASDDGDTPFEVNATIVDASAGAGDIWQRQTATDAGFTNIVQDIEKQISPAEFEGTVNGDWTASAFPAPSAPYVTQFGTFYERWRIKRHTDAGTTVSGWSNILTETILSYTGTFSPSRKSFQTVLSNDNLTMLNTDQGYGQMGLAEGTLGLTAATGAVELTLDVVGTRGEQYAGITDGSQTDLSTGLITSNNARYRADAGAYYVNTTYVGDGSAFGAGGKVLIVAHRDSRKVWYRVGGTWVNGTPVFDADGSLNGSATGGSVVGGTTPLLPFAGGPGGDGWTINQGQGAFTNALPANCNAGWS